MTQISNLLSIDALQHNLEKTRGIQNFLILQYHVDETHKASLLDIWCRSCHKQFTRHYRWLTENLLSFSCPHCRCREEPFSVRPPSRHPGLTGLVAKISHYTQLRPLKADKADFPRRRVGAPRRPLKREDFPVNMRVTPAILLERPQRPYAGFDPTEPPL